MKSTPVTEDDEKAFGGRLQSKASPFKSGMKYERLISSFILI
jgi:hypothetical protein